MFRLGMRTHVFSFFLLFTVYLEVNYNYFFFIKFYFITKY